MLQEDTFLAKLNDTVKRIGEYHSMIGSEKGERKMKMQGVMKDDVVMDVSKHFTKVDYKAEKI